MASCRFHMSITPMLTQRTTSPVQRVARHWHGTASATTWSGFHTAAPATAWLARWPSQCVPTRMRSSSFWPNMDSLPGARPTRPVTPLQSVRSPRSATSSKSASSPPEADEHQNLDPDAASPVYRASDAASDPHPRVILIPGVGMFTTGKDAMMADVSSQLYHRAIAVMRGAEACGGFISLSDAESYAVEYWPLEQYKLKMAPPEREFARHVVLVTGAAGGIGSATCRRVAQDGAHIVATDIDLAGAEQLAAYLNQHFGAGRAIAVKMDVTNEESVRAAFEQAALAFGGIDVIVNNAGLASSASITETSLAQRNKNWNVLATSYFLVSREGFRFLQAQARGVNLVFVASKNALVAGKNAAAYSTAKAAEAHLARCLAEEGGQFGIRINTVNPDAVLAGSRIWGSSWRQERAATYGVAPDQLEEVYRKRTTLGVNILPEDIAEAVAFFASPTRSSKSTGNILNVDGGVAAAYPR